MSRGSTRRCRDDTQRRRPRRRYLCRGSMRTLAAVGVGTSVGANAALRGWSLRCSSARAICTARAASKPSKASTATSSGVAPVNVPVLSKITRRMRASRSSTCARVITKPRRRSARVATVIAIGVANDSAQGHDTTSTAIAAGSAIAGSAKCQNTNVAAAIASTAATKCRATASACTATRGLSSVARCARRWMSATRVCAGRFVATTVIGCATFSVPAYTRAPIVFATGRDSPVNVASSTCVAPATTSPSTAMREPEGTTMRSPARIASSGIVSTPPFVSRRAVSGSSASQWSKRPSRRRACCSRNRAPSSRNTNIVIESKYTSPVPRTVAIALATNATAIGECHRHVHRKPRRTAPYRAGKRRHGVFEERPRGIQHHRRGEDERGPTKQLHVVRAHVIDVGHVQRQREHHHLHHRERGNRDTLQLPASFGTRARIVDLTRDVHRRVAGGGDGVEHRAQCNAIRVVVEHHTMLRRIDAHAFDVRRLR